MNSPHTHSGASYEIQVQGELDQAWETWFHGLAITVSHGRGRPAITTLTGSVADQAELRGVIGKLWDLNLTLISVRCVDTSSEEECEGD